LFGTLDNPYRRPKPAYKIGGWRTPHQRKNKIEN